MKNNRFFRGPLVWVGLILLVTLVFTLFSNPFSGAKEVPTSQIIQILDGNEKIKSVTLIDGEQQIRMEMDNPAKDRYRATWVGTQSQEIIKKLNERAKDKTLAEWKGENPDRGFWGTILNLVLLVVMGFFFFFMLNAAQGGGSRLTAFGKSRAKVANKDTPKTTFADVAGCDEAIEELQEIREFLAEPAKFQAVGAKIPKGVLLYGQPGTGKTLLARAVAGEAGVPFFSISGSDFVEMFVGVGASRVRDLFEQAKENAPAIVFIDEIDAVGRHRGAGMGGGHDEREQTLNQLLVEMDGFDVRGGVILIAATNRPDVLDPALLRPGRFDRQISVDPPDLKGRFDILKVHAQGKPIAPGTDLAAIARRTPGFTGADLANVLNEAALLTARQNLRQIGNPQLDEAIDRVIAGPQKKSRLMDEKEKLITAYHEGGHALVAAAMPGTDPVQKVTILPRGRALGYTMVMPDEDKYSQTRGELLDQLAYMLGGRAAEELVFHDPTTGASNDIEKATKVARAMVTQYGMSEKVGAVRLGAGDREPFLGMEMGTGGRDYSEEVAGIVDQEVSALINEAHQEAFDCLNENRDVLDELVRQLFEHETLDKQQVAKIFEPLKRHPAREPWTGSPTRVPSSIPPVTPPPSPTPPALPGPDEQGPVGAPHYPQPTNPYAGPGGHVPPGGVQLPPGHLPGVNPPETGQQHPDGQLPPSGPGAWGPPQGGPGGDGPTPPSSVR